MTTWVPESCTLPTAEQPLRVAEFDELFAGAVGPPRRVAPERLEVVLPAEAEPVARDLVARETACCSFFTFTFRPEVAGIVLTVEVPLAQVPVLDAVQRRVEAVRSARSGRGSTRAGARQQHRDRDQPDQPAEPPHR